MFVDELLSRENNMKILNVNWLGSCERCDCEDVIVRTMNGDENFLYEDDEIECSCCGLKGVVQIDDINADDDSGVAFASWGDL